MGILFEWRRIDFSKRVLNSSLGGCSIMIKLFTPKWLRFYMSIFDISGAMCKQAYL